MWESGWWNLYKTTSFVEDHLRESFPFKRPLREERLLEQIGNGRLFGNLQCDIEVPEELRKNFANFPPIFENTNVGRHDIELPVKDYAQKEGLLCQPRKMLISKYFHEKGTLITSLLLFYLDLGLVCKKFYVRREGDESPNASAVAETMKLLPDGSYGYQFMDRSRHTVKKSLSDEKTLGAVKKKNFKRLDHISDQLFEVELAKAEIEHGEPINVGFFILHYAKT